MKRFLLIIIMACAACSAFAQNAAGTPGTSGTSGTSGTGAAYSDSLVYRPAAALDSLLYGKSIFNLLPSKAKGDAADVKVHQSEAIAAAMRTYIASNASRAIGGFRVRIFFDNKQNARSASEAAMSRFVAGGYGVAAYRSYQNPFFKVTVGDFRTKSEAMELLERIKYEFPSAFIVKENINFPVSRAARDENAFL